MDILIDTHAHYGDERFNTEFPGGVKAALDSAREKGVCCFINASTSIEDSKNSLKLAHENDGMYAAIGIHPEDCEKYDISSVDSVMSELEALTRDERAVAIGEIGLDYYWDIPREPQKIWFEAQLRLAEELDMPVVIHDRDAHGDMTDILLSHPKVRGVLHSYSGSREMALELVKRGWYISFSGVLTFKNARKAVEAADVVPLDRLLLETDCPYLAPHPHRGKMNYSGYMIHTAEKLAEVKGVSYSDICRITTENAKGLFGIACF